MVVLSSNLICEISSSLAAPVFEVLALIRVFEPAAKSCGLSSKKAIP